MYMTMHTPTRSFGGVVGGWSGVVETGTRAGGAAGFAVADGLSLVASSEQHFDYRFLVQHLCSSTPYPISLAGGCEEAVGRHPVICGIFSTGLSDPRPFLPARAAADCSNDLLGGGAAPWRPSMFYIYMFRLRPVRGSLGAHWGTCQVAVDDR